MANPRHRRVDTTVWEIYNLAYYPLCCRIGVHPGTKWPTTLLLALSLAISAGAAYSLPNDSQPHPSTKKRNLDADRSEYYKKWFNEDVVYIITEEEKKVFQNLRTDEEFPTIIKK